MTQLKKTPAVIWIAGSDAGRVSEVESRVAEAVTVRGCRLIVDLGEADSIDSLMLARLVAADKAIGSVGGRMAIAAAAPELRRMLELTGLERRLDLYETGEAALLALRGD
jgi:anti-sigma B factor antagonist